MKPDMFRQPVSILVGLGFPAEVRRVMDAYRHLVEWPASMRDTAHSIMRRGTSRRNRSGSRTRPVCRLYREARSAGAGKQCDCRVSSSKRQGSACEVKQ
jgi:hypothetical protein